jgi:sec-independent protein translocase protein TatA
MELGLGEMVIVLIVVLLLFGPSKLPQLGESLGRAIRNFKDAAAPPPQATPSRPAELPASPHTPDAAARPAEADPEASDGKAGAPPAAAPGAGPRA